MYKQIQQAIRESLVEQALERNRIYCACPISFELIRQHYPDLQRGQNWFMGTDSVGTLKSMQNCKDRLLTALLQADVMCVESALALDRVEFSFNKPTQSNIVICSIEGDAPDYPVKLLQRYKHYILLDESYGLILRRCKIKLGLSDIDVIRDSRLFEMSLLQNIAPPSTCPPFSPAIAAHIKRAWRSALSSTGVPVAKSTVQTLNNMLSATDLLIAQDSSLQESLES